MGLMSDHREANVEGHLIEVEARVLGLSGAGEFSLIVDRRSVDQIRGSYGTFRLRGSFETDGRVRSVVVVLKQGIATTKYRLEVDGQEYALRK